MEATPNQDATLPLWVGPAILDRPLSSTISLLITPDEPMVNQIVKGGPYGIRTQEHVDFPHLALSRALAPDDPCKAAVISTHRNASGEGFRIRIKRGCPAYQWILQRWFRASTLNQIALPISLRVLLYPKDIIMVVPMIGLKSGRPLTDPFAATREGLHENAQASSTKTGRTRCGQPPIATA